MINTDNYIRWERVDSVHQTATGILAELHREQLRIDVIRADVLRIKISRGGVFARLRLSQSASTHLPHPSISGWNGTWRGCS